MVAAHSNVQPHPRPPTLQNDIDAFNEALDELTLHSQKAAGLLDPKGPRRKELAAAAVKAAAAAPAPGAAAAPGVAPPAAGSPPPRPGAPATAKLEGPELLLAAAAYGAGL